MGFIYILSLKIKLIGTDYILNLTGIKRIFTINEPKDYGAIKKKETMLCALTAESSNSFFFFFFLLTFLTTIFDYLQAGTSLNHRSSDTSTPVLLLACSQMDPSISYIIDAGSISVHNSSMTTICLPRLI